MGRREAVLVVLACTLAWTPVLGPSARSAEGVSASAFSPDERTIIARNESLRRGLEHDPGAVRSSLQALAAARAAGAGTARSREGTIDGLFDEATDPDLDRLQRASPEAAYDLFQLLKKASDSSAPVPTKSSR